MTKEQLIGCYNYEQGIINLDGKEIYLTPRENKLFNILVHNYNIYLKSEILCKEIYGENLDEGFELALRTCISRARKKLKGLVNIKRRNHYGYKLEVIKK